MYYPFRYQRIKAIPHCYAVYLDGQFLGEVRRWRGGWYFDTFDEPRYHSPVPAYVRSQAVLQWPGLKNFPQYAEL